MPEQRILSLDVSTKTGWAFVTADKGGYTLERSGQFKPIPRPKSDYPGDMVDWARNCFAVVKKLIDECQPTVLVIEETSKGSKNSSSQKILEFTHFLLASFIQESKIKSIYFQTGEWRKLTGCQMTEEEKERNKYVRKYKKEHAKEAVIIIDEKTGKKRKKAIVVYDKEGKRIGLVGKKNVSVRRANEVFGKYFKKPLKRKEEDLADALMLAYAYMVRERL